jgi:hypothetical protein
MWSFFAQHLDKQGRHKLLTNFVLQMSFEKGQIEVMPDQSATDNTTASSSQGSIGNATISLGELSGAYEALSSLSNQAMALKVSARVTQLLRYARPHYESILEATRSEAQRHGTPVEDGQFFIPPKNAEAYQAALAPLHSRRVPFDPAARIDIEQLAEVKITPTSFERLMPFLSGV